VSREERRLSFGAHAEAYERARPDWPDEAARWFVPEGARLVVEAGAGTGKLTRALTRVAPRVLAVEPDPRMRELLQVGIEGTAEAIPLGDGEADAVVAGSALHWFDLDRALPEFRRVLRDGGRLAFGWNHRAARHPAVERMQERIGQVRVPTGSWQARDWAAEVTAGGLFGDVEHAEFPFILDLPRSALDDHLLSYSGLALLPEDVRRRVFAEIGQVLDSDAEVRRGDRLALPFVVDAYRARAL